MNLKLFSQWFSWLTGPQRPVHNVTVFTRNGCTCCDKAMNELEKAGRRYHLNITLVDVDTDPALAAEHGLHVPVIAIDGKVRFKGQINPILLERILKHS